MMKKEICFSDLILLANPIEQNVEQLIECGADKVELLMDGPLWDAIDEQIAKMSRILPKYEVGYSIHPPAWDTSLTSENRTIREASFLEYKKAIQFAHMIEAEHVVIHPGFCVSPVFDKAIARKRAREAINQLCEIAKPLGVKLAVENVGYKGSSIFTEDEFVYFLDDIDETAGFLLDTGHAYLNSWDIPKLIRRIHNRLLAIHLHDNGGEKDEHMPIREGTMEWEQIFDVLKELQPSCQFILEYVTGTDLNKLEQGKQLLIQRLDLKSNIIV